MNLTAAAELQSALDPAGTQAGHISQLWWIYFWVLIVIFPIVAVFISVAILRGRTTREIEIPPPPTEGTERRISTVVISLVVATVIILFALLFIDIFSSRSVFALSREPNALSLKIIGHQWWWELH